MLRLRCATGEGERRKTGYEGKRQPPQTSIAAAAYQSPLHWLAPPSSCRGARYVLLRCAPQNGRTGETDCIRFVYPLIRSGAGKVSFPPLRQSRGSLHLWSLLPFPRMGKSHRCVKDLAGRICDPSLTRSVSASEAAAAGNAAQALLRRCTSFAQALLSRCTPCNISCNIV